MKVCKTDINAGEGTNAKVISDVAKQPESSNSKNPIHVEKARFHFGKNLGDETVNVTVPDLVESDLQAVHVDHAQHEDLEGWTQVIRKGKYKMGQKPSPSTHQVQPKAKMTPNKATNTWTRPNHQRTTHATGSKVKLSRGINIRKPVSVASSETRHNVHHQQQGETTNDTVRKRLRPNSLQNLPVDKDGASTAGMVQVSTEKIGLQLESPLKVGSSKTGTSC
ncbi:hypothetical protein S83_034746 [Arachis hypogaea]